MDPDFASSLHATAYPEMTSNDSLQYDNDTSDSLAITSPVSKRQRGMEAQRAFRKRKAAHLQELEHRVALFEMENSQLRVENARLREEVSSLKRLSGAGFEEAAAAGQNGDMQKLLSQRSTCKDEIGRVNSKRKTSKSKRERSSLNETQELHGKVDESIDERQVDDYNAVERTNGSTILPLRASTSMKEQSPETPGNSLASILQAAEQVLSTNIPVDRLERNKTVKNVPSEESVVSASYISCPCFTAF